MKNLVIGGSLGQKVRDGIFRADVIGFIDWTLVESELMVEQLSQCGVKNVLQLPNFKPIPYMPELHRNKGKLRFVFLSRIMPEKGCDYLLECAERLNEKGLAERYEIDFYGKIADEYSNEFSSRIEQLQNVSYCGFLNLMENSGYDRLAEYDMMIFPTYWKGEGFAGVFIDAFISGLPILATDWAHNRQFLKEGETALFVPVHDVDALSQKMEECILGKHNLQRMAETCQAEAAKYNVDNVVTKELLERIGLLNR